MRILIAAVFCASIQAAPNCTATGPSPVPVLHAEGLNEPVGDIILTCTSDASATQPIPLVNINVILNVPVTGRILPVSSNGGLAPSANNASEAIILINEPGNTNPVVPAVIDQNQQLSCLSGLPPGGATLPNLCYGTQSSIKGVSFNNVPLVSNPTQFLITNIRANVTGLGAGGSGTVPLIASLFISGSASNTIPNLPVGTVKKGLNVHVSQSASLPTTSTGTSVSIALATLLRFEEEYLGALQPPPSTIPSGFQNPFPPASPPALVAGFDAVPGVAISVPQTVPSVDGTTRINLITDNTSPSQLGAGFVQLPLFEGKAFAGYTQTGNPTTPQTYDVSIGANFSSGIPPFVLTTQSFLGPSDGNFPQFYAIGGGPYAVIQGVNPNAPTISLTVTANIGSQAICYAGPQQLRGPLNACDVGGDQPAIPFFLFSNQSSGTASLSVAPVSGLNSFITNNPGYDTGLDLSTAPLPVSAGINLPSSTPAAAGPPAAATTDTIKLTATVPGAGTLNASYPVTVLAATTPVILPQGFTDVADFRSGVVSPGLIFSLFPQTYGQPSANVGGTVDAKGFVTTTVANTQVFFDGQAVPILGVTPTQINGIAPFELTGKTSTRVTLVYQGVSSPTITLPVQPASISIISASGFGGGPCACLNQDGSYNSQTNPTFPGDVITMIVNYGGPMDVAGTDGRTTIAPPYNKPQGPVTASIGGVAVTSLPYVGNLPGFVESAEQWNLQIPAGVQPGLNMISISAGGATNAPFASIWVGQK